MTESGPVPNDKWYKIGGVLAVHGYCHSNLKTGWYRWPDLTPEKIAYLSQMVIFEPKMEVEAIGYDPDTGGFTLVNKLDPRYESLKAKFTEANREKIEWAKRESERRQLNKELGEIVMAQKKKNRENEILRQAATIIFARTQENPGSVDIKLKPGRPERVKLTSFIHDGTGDTSE